MPFRVLWIALLSSGLLLGQTSIGTGFEWSLSDALQTGDNVVIADLLGGSREGNSIPFALHAQVKIVRTLRGTLLPKTVVNLAWRYLPSAMETFAEYAKVPEERVFCVLRSQLGGTFEVLRLGRGPHFTGGYFITVPAAPPSGSFFAPATASPEVKIANELGWDIDDLFARYGPALRPRAGQDRATWRERIEANANFHTMADILLELAGTSPASVEPIFQTFSRRPEPDLEMLGIAGRLRTGELAALAQLEQDQSRLLESGLIDQLSSSLNRSTIWQTPESLLTLAQIAFAEQTFSGMEDVLLIQADSSRKIEVAPYLMALMESPSPSLRGGALMGMCLLVERAALWKSEMAAYCPHVRLTADRAQEQQDLQYWKEWWTVQKPELAKTVALPVVTIPARYTDPPPTTGLRTK